MLYAMLFSAVYAENGPKKHITERNPLIKRLVNLEANGGYPTSRTPGSRRSLVSRRRLAAAEARKALRAGQRRRLAEPLAWEAIVQFITAAEKALANATAAGDQKAIDVNKQALDGMNETWKAIMQIHTSAAKIAAAEKALADATAAGDQKEIDVKKLKQALDDANEEWETIIQIPANIEAAKRHVTLDSEDSEEMKGMDSEDKNIYRAQKIKQEVMNAPDDDTSDEKSMSDHYIWEDKAYDEVTNQSNSTRRADFDVNLNALESMFFMVSKEVTTGTGTEWKPLGDHHAIKINGQDQSIRTFIRNEHTHAVMTEHFNDQTPLVCEIKGKKYMVTRYINTTIPTKIWENRYSDSFINLARSVWEKLRIIREDFAKIPEDGKVFTDEDMEGNYMDYQDFEKRRQVYERCVDLLIEERKEMGECSENWTKLLKLIKFQPDAPVKILKPEELKDLRGKLLKSIGGSNVWTVQLDNGSKKNVTDDNMEVVTKELSPEIQNLLKEMNTKKEKVDADNDINIKKIQNAETLFETVETMRQLREVMVGQKEKLEQTEEYKSFLKEAKTSFKKEYGALENKPKPTQPAEYNTPESGMTGFTDLFKECKVLNPDRTYQAGASVEMLSEREGKRGKLLKPIQISGSDAWVVQLDKPDDDGKSKIKVLENNMEVLTTFKEHLLDLKALCKKEEIFKGAEFKTVDNKGETRGMYKFFYKYGGDASQLTDIVRASIILPSCKPVKDKYPIIEMVHKINKHFEKWGGIMRIKDRFNKPVNEYSDILLNVKCENIICEIQVHLKPFFKIKNGEHPESNADKIVPLTIKTANGKVKVVDMHKAYELSRRFTNYFNKICNEEKAEAVEVVKQSLAGLSKTK